MSLKIDLSLNPAAELFLTLKANLIINQFVPFRAFIISGTFFFIVEFQWFLIELSVLPGNILVIYAHLLPWAIWAKNKIHYY
jgi:hypothetical protein